ncbi:F-box protein At3g07870-like [Papaver somniferum]|uniref:F-box protein At3g07870-like n=1 Tax=Papaver somniferum TaxID=3469 RepID=UPI000E6FBCAF|nr:F-box protein At3g07870-like [Papaver somniferum]
MMVSIMHLLILYIKSKVLVGNILGTSNGLIKNLNIDLTAIILSHFPIECVSLGRAVCRLWRIFLKKPKTGFLLAVSEEKSSGDIKIFHRYIEEVSIHDEPISYKKLAMIDLGLGQFQTIHVKMIKSGPFRHNIFGSCNGLVCFPVQKDEKKWLVYICNPMTGEYVYLPEMDFGEISRPKVLVGFGYCKSTNEYKVVQVTYEYSQFKQLGRVQVYTLGGGSGWRNKGGTRYTCQERLVFANEELYWIERLEDEWNIRVFYLVDETFSTLPMPPCHGLFCGYKGLIVSLNGSLCVYHDTVERISDDEAEAHPDEYNFIIGYAPEEETHNRKEERRIDMWILKKEQRKQKKKSEWYSPVDENDDSNSWVWVLEISMKYNSQYPYYRHYEPFSITNNNQVLMWEDHKVHRNKAVICYDPNTLTFKNLCDEAYHPYEADAQAIPHMKIALFHWKILEKSPRGTFTFQMIRHHNLQFNSNEKQNDNILTEGCQEDYIAACEEANVTVTLTCS